MAMFSSGSFTTSTPFHQQYDSGFYGNSPQSRSSSQFSIGENIGLEIGCFFPLRKNLFGKRNNSENIPVDPFSLERKLLLSRSSAFSRRDASSNTETPRTARSCAGSDKPVKIERLRQNRRCFLNGKTERLKWLGGNDSGFHAETPESSECLKSKGRRIPLLEMVKNLNSENSKEESLAYFKRFLDVSGAKSFADLSMSDIQDLYNIHRFQRTGLKPSVTDIDFNEERPLMKDLNEGNEVFLSSWKERLECISADIKMPPKIDILSQLHNINALSLISCILSYLSGHDLQTVSSVSRLWRKLVLEDEVANRARLACLEKRQKFIKEMAIKKSVNPFQRQPNDRILSCIENIQKEELQFKKTIKEINFNAFIEVGKKGENYRPMKCPSCCNLSLQDKHIITKYNCLFCGHEFCCNCLKPYSNWHYCAPINFPTKKPPANGKKYLRRL
ncbi:F-box only protein 5-like [Argiope bruennichi]|uniref:F-box only protein 5-like n=1 Tax=Argiope bruennichi TaxID=94029 RepID=UPI002494F7B9|nr:F-box only protein 5-like [Argiope bruennichi]